MTPWSQIRNFYQTDPMIIISDDPLFLGEKIGLFNYLHISVEFFVFFFLATMSPLAVATSLIIGYKPSVSYKC